MKRIYLAGPEVFLPNAVEQGKVKKALCQEYGFEGCYPLDNEIDAGSKSPREVGHLISNVNEDLIDTCSIIIANLTPFRGPSADVGTVYELGYARGKDLFLCGYTNVVTLYKERVPEDAYTVENFDLHDNLMIEGGITRANGIFLTHDGNGDIANLDGFVKMLQALRDKL